MRASTMIVELAKRVCSLDQAHPVRVAVDGRTASGKTTLADELGAAVAQLGRPVIRTTIDGFHNPRIVRYRQGRSSPLGYYQDARDLGAVRRLLLDPLGASGDRFYRTASFDLERDEPVEQEPQHAPINAVVIVDGTFLQRPELAGSWDYVIFVDVPEHIATERGIRRDTLHLGSEGAANAHAQRYQPAFSLYCGECDPATRANAIVENGDLATPRLTFRSC